jgi:hypothetical protein
VLVAAGLDLLLQFYRLGYPGIPANGNFSRHEALFVAGNATFYVLVFEGLAA